MRKRKNKFRSDNQFYNKAAGIRRLGREAFSVKMDEQVAHIGPDGQAGIVILQRRMGTQTTYNTRESESKPGKTISTSLSHNSKYKTSVYLHQSASTGKPVYISAVDFVKRVPGDVVWVQPSEKRGLHRTKKHGTIVETFIKCEEYEPSLHGNISDDMYDMADEMAAVLDRSIGMMREMRDITGIELDSLGAKVDALSEEVKKLAESLGSTSS